MLHVIGMLCLEIVVAGVFTFIVFRAVLQMPEPPGDDNDDPPESVAVRVAA